MAQREQTSVVFKISSASLSARELETRLGLKPDLSWKAGEARGAFGAVEKLHGFVLESDRPAQNELGDHLKAMLKRLAPHAQKIGALAKDATIEMTCQVHRKSGPRLRFDRDDLRWLGVMGARLDVDVFILVDKPAPAAAPKPPAPDDGKKRGFGAF
ncbi:MAG: DUF4279 domain-containing protein [Elusimicrobia bacterium]|nr:DUF4279 domain-containing protein [Elusimicrobiota bacterium]